MLINNNGSFLLLTKDRVIAASLAWNNSLARRRRSWDDALGVVVMGDSKNIKAGARKKRSAGQ